MPSPDELADALASRIAVATGSDYRRSIRAFARDAAKQALLDAASSFTMPATGAKVRPWLRARAEQIGTRDGD